MTDENTTQIHTNATPAQAAQAATPDPEPSASTRFAVYDKTFLKFIGGTHSTRKGAQAAAKASGLKRFEIREV